MLSPAPWCETPMNPPLCDALLIRLPAGAGAALGAAGGAARSLRSSGVRFELEPLFVAGGGGGAGVGLTGGGSEWHIARPVGDARSASAWDTAHEAMGAMGIVAPEFVEPDLIQEWPFQRPRGEGVAAAAAAVCA